MQSRRCVIEIRISKRNLVTRMQWTVKCLHVFSILFLGYGIFASQESILYPVRICGRLTSHDLAEQMVPRMRHCQGLIVCGIQQGFNHGQ